MEMDKTAVDKQSDLLNNVQLMETKQECDEPVRSYVARLKGQANICSLTMKCPCNTCTETMSYMDSTILLALVKGLHDKVTKG